MCSQTHIWGLPQVLTCGLGTGPTIDVLPEDTLLDIFDFDRIHEDDYSKWRWDRLVHVCRRWRQIIFANPLRLHLQLRCTRSTPIRKYLGVWPPLPLAIDYDLRKGRAPNHKDNLLAALEDPDRVGLLYLRIKGPDLAKLATALRKPFPILTKLRLSLEGKGEVALPREFLGGSMPRLQELHLNAIPFAKLPKLLLSARDLVTLQISEVPPDGQISPEKMAGCLATLTRLTSLSIVFHSQFFAGHGDKIDPASVTPIVLPTLSSIKFHGLSEYVEALLTQIECPRLKNIDLSYLHPFLGFHMTQLFNFINRSEDPRPPLFGQMDVILASAEITIKISDNVPDHIAICLRLSGLFDWDVSHIVQVCDQFSTKLSNMRHLSINSKGRGPERPELGRSDWLQLFCPFTTIQTLSIFGDYVDRVALLFEEGDEQIASALLPALELLCIHGLPVSSVAKFCAVRRLSGRPVTFVKTQMEFSRKLESYRGE